MKRKAIISIECGNLAPNDGMVTVWWWKNGKDFNQELKSKKPIWEILNAHQTFLLCSVGETIEIDENKILKHFEVVQ
jgi:hypothetical protein